MSAVVPPAPAQLPPHEPVPPPVTPPSPVLDGPASTANAGGAEPGKFKLKPKVPSVPPAAPAPQAAAATPNPLQGATAGAPPAPPISTAGAVPPTGPAVTNAGAPKAPPPFPVVAPPAGAKPPSAVPHVTVKSEVPPAERETPVIAATGKRKNTRLALLALAAVLVLGGAGFYAWQTFLAAPPVPIVVKKAPAPVITPKASPAATATPAPNTPAGTPSETLNKIAHAPANAIQKAQDAIAARRESGQSRVDAAAAGLDLPDKPAVPAPGSAGTTMTTSGSRAVAPGVTASTELQAAAEASPAFKSFVANAKVSGVVATRAIINGRLTRAGETIDAGQGITFEGYDSEKNQLLFKDRSGATVSRRYP